MPADRQLDMFDVASAEAARDASIDQVELSTAEWQEQAILAIRAVARIQPTITTDDVWRVLGRDPDLEGRAMGAAMRTAAGLGYVERTDVTQKSKRVACHRRDLRVWRSLIFQP